MTSISTLKFFYFLNFAAFDFKKLQRGLLATSGSSWRKRPSLGDAAQVRLALQHFPQRSCFQPSKPSNAVRVPSFLHGARSGAGGGEERLPVDHLPLCASNRHLHLGGGELGRGEGGPRGPGGPGGRRQRRFSGGGEDKLEVD